MLKLLKPKVKTINVLIKFNLLSFKLKLAFHLTKGARLSAGEAKSSFGFCRFRNLTRLRLETFIEQIYQDSNQIEYLVHLVVTLSKTF